MIKKTTKLIASHFEMEFHISMLMKFYEIIWFDVNVFFKQKILKNNGDGCINLFYNTFSSNDCKKL